MNTLVIGIIIGFAMFGLIAGINLIFKLREEMTAMHRLMQMTVLKINKIEKMSEASMNAAETFVDALRNSAEQMMRPSLPQEEFDDLRKSFEDGIKSFEENEMNDLDDEDGEEKEPWKKK